MYVCFMVAQIQMIDHGSFDYCGKAKALFFAEAAGKCRRVLKVMEFKFNFSTENSDCTSSNANDQPAVAQDTNADKKEKGIHIRPVKDVTIPEQPSTDEGIDILRFTIGSQELLYLDPCDVEVRILSGGDTDNAVVQAISDHSDLLPHMYEGGLKVWECSLDLVQYLHEADIDFTNLKVLELGCGAGLPGIFALKHGAEEVIFQDYNEEVLQEMTISNAVLNIPNDETRVTERCRFLAGDWSLLETFLKKTAKSLKYDIILTAETIYSIESQPILHDLLKDLLKPGGTVYVAAKTHYFGVGGGTRMFEDLVRERGDFTIDICKEYKQGVQREILKMKLVQAPR